MKTQNITIGMWAKINNTTAQTLLVAEPKQAYAVGLGAALIVAGDNSLHFQKGNGSGWQTTPFQSQTFAGTWHYISLTYDGSMMKLYIDGALNSFLANASGIGWTD